MYRGTENELPVSGFLKSLRPEISVSYIWNYDNVYT
jgi:hypothetical protein